MGGPKSMIIWIGVAAVVVLAAVLLLRSSSRETDRSGRAEVPAPPFSAPQSPSKPLFEMTTEEVITALESSTRSPEYIVSELARRGDKRAVPLLKSKFDVIEDVSEKQQIARALVDLGVTDESYYEFLSGLAELAISSSRPFPIAFDAEGKMIPRVLRPEFLEWSEKQGREPSAEAFDALYGAPGDVLVLASVGDERSATVLRRGLRSPNHLIALYSAQGLAMISDIASVSLIESTAAKAPAEFAIPMALTLVFFGTPDATQRAERLLPDSSRIEKAKALAATKGPHGVFDSVF